MQGDVQKLTEQVAELTAQVITLSTRNQELHDQVQYLISQMFRSRSEKLDPNQLELLSGLLAESVKPSNPSDDEPPPPPGGGKTSKKRTRKPRIPEHLPIDEERVIEPEEIKADPEAYRRIGEEVTDEMDVTLPRYFRRRIIRPKYVRIDQREAPPIIAALPPRIIPGGYAGVGILTDIVLKKYQDHLPLYRQEQILRSRHGIELSRKTMSDWVEQVAQWLKPIYNHIADELRKSGYLQIDETPVRYCQAKGGGSAQGYLWVYNRPGGAVLYDWHTSRSARCLRPMLEGFTGTIQSDGYQAYASYAKGRQDLTQAACWAHARRKFHEAQEEAPREAHWFLHQIGLLYRIERELRTSDTPATLREPARQAASRMILDRLHQALKTKLTSHRPRSRMGKAIAYTLNLWESLNTFAADGRLEIDNNLVENAIRPTAIGKKNWLFIGGPEAGERSAIIYTLLENCKRLGIPPQDYLQDVLSRLPGMMNHQTHELTPAKWLATRTEAQANAA